MEKLAKLTCPEREDLVRGSELAFDDAKSLESLNFVGGSPLKINASYLIVPQQNTGRRYTIGDNPVVSKRFWAIEMDGSKLTDVARTIGLSSLRGMHVGHATLTSTAPTFEVQRNNAGKLRAVVPNYYRALEDTSFLHGDEKNLRAEITTPVVVTVTKRGGVYTLEYDNTTRDVKTNSAGQALASENTRFYQFALGSKPEQKLVQEATEMLVHSYPEDFYPLGGK